MNTYVQAVTDDNRKAQTEFEKRFSGNGERIDRKIRTVSPCALLLSIMWSTSATRKKHFELNQAWAYYALLFGAEP